MSFKVPIQDIKDLLDEHYTFNMKLAKTVKDTAWADNVYTYSSAQRGVEPSVTYKMRCILYGWLLEIVHNVNTSNTRTISAKDYIDRYRYNRKITLETYIYTSIFIDKVLEKADDKIILIKRSKLQRIGVVSMTICTKLLDIVPLSLKDGSYLSNDSHSLEDAKITELFILKLMDYNLTVITPVDFIYHIIDKTVERNFEITHTIETILTIWSLTKYISTEHPKKIAAVAVSAYYHINKINKRTHTL